jgi:hypothetical protein
MTMSKSPRKSRQVVPISIGCIHMEWVVRKRTNVPSVDMKRHIDGMTIVDKEFV